METKGTNIHRDLIEKCRLNDKQAQFELYKIFYKPMFNTSLRILNDRAEAEDIMQESFIDAFSKIGEYSGEGSFGGWLRRIVINNSIDALKKRKPTLSFEEEHFEVASEDNEIKENIDYKIAEIKKAVNSLPEDHRVIISLFLFEGYDHEEISGILNISNGASRTRYSRARQKLLRILSDQRTVKMYNPN